MTIPAHYPGEKVPDEIRECQSCHLKVIARGDQYGWKGVDAGGGVLAWFCDKSICQQQRDEFIARRQSEMMIEQQKAALQAAQQKPVEALSDQEAADEEERLKARLMALRTRRRQTAAEEPEPVIAPDPDPERPRDAGLFEGVKVHQTRDGVTSLCGEEGALFAVGEDLPENCIPCVECGEIFSAQVQEHSPSPVAVDSGPQEAQEAPPDPELAREGGGEVRGQKRPPQVDLEVMPRFTPELIQDILAGAYDGGYILIPPSAYPDMNLEVMDPEQLRPGISKMFGNSAAPLEVDDIKRARRGEEFKGVVFTLRAVPAVPAQPPKK